MQRGLKECLTAVENEIKNGEVFLARRHNHARPAVDLPFEILEHIFVALCDRSTYPPGDATLYGEAMRENRSAICSVCSRWREVALTATSLWKTVFIDTVMGCTRSILPVRTEIARARNSPITVYLCNIDPGLVGTVINGLKKTTPRYNTIYFNGGVYDSQLFSDLLDLPGASTVRALYLRWECVSLIHRDGERNVVNLSALSSLHSLCIETGFNLAPLIPHPHSQLYIPPSTSNITRMRLTGRVDVGSCLELINASPLLQMLDWHRTVLDILGHHIYDVQPLGWLRDLRLHGRTPLSLMTHLRAPNLRRLCLGASSWGDRDCIALICAGASQHPKLEILGHQ